MKNKLKVLGEVILERIVFIVFIIVIYSPIVLIPLLLYWVVNHFWGEQGLDITNYILFVIYLIVFVTWIILHIIDFFNNLISDYKDRIKKNK